MQVLHFIGSGIYGGAENFVYTLAKQQNEQGQFIKPAILYRYGKGTFFERAINDGIATYVCPPKISLTEFIRIIRFIRTFDILHYHGLMPLLFFAGILSGRKKLYYIHGARAVTKSPREAFRNFRDSGHIPGFRSIRRIINRQWLKLFLRHFSEINHTPSEFYKRFYIRKYNIPFNKIEVMPIGVDFEQLKVTNYSQTIKEQLHINDQCFVLGTVSTFRKLKRIDRLIIAFNGFRQENPSNHSKLVVVGDGVERENLETLVSKLGIQEQVIFTGMQRNVSDYLNIMDAFVLPSESESFSISCVEAMYFSLPVIVFKGSGGAEEIVAKSGGFIALDENHLLKIIMSLYADSSLIENIGNALHNYAIENFSIQKVNNLLLSQYLKCMK